MDFLNDQKKLPIVIVVLVLTIGGAVASCVHFLAKPTWPPLAISAGNRSNLNPNAPLPIDDQGHYIKNSGTGAPTSTGN